MLFHSFACKNKNRGHRIIRVIIYMLNISIIFKPNNLNICQTCVFYGLRTIDMMHILRGSGSKPPQAKATLCDGKILPFLHAYLYPPPRRKPPRPSTPLRRKVDSLFACLSQRPAPMKSRPPPPPPQRLVKITSKFYLYLNTVLLA